MASPDKFNYLPKAADLLKKSQSAEGPDRLKVYKNYLQAGLDALTKQFQKGTSIIQLLRARSALMDHILVTSWSQFSVNTGSTLIAVGGYGREELQPYSDIDILVLLNEENGGEEAPERNLELESWLAFLWDIGLEVGHSVRTIDQCESLALEDISVATNLIESRFLCGDLGLLKDLNSRIKQPDFWPSRKFFVQNWMSKQHDTSNLKKRHLTLSPISSRTLVD